jgi:ribonucleoside-triphosphate reductase
MILYSHRKLIEHLIECKSLPLYPAGWISLKRQYSTIGFIGTYEYVVNKGLDIKTDEGIAAVTNILTTIEKKIVKWQEVNKDVIMNIEQIPGESMCVRLCEMDTLLGYNKHKWQMYSNQYIPLIEDASIYDRCRIQGKIDKMTSGGAILHINVDDEKPLSPKQLLKVMDLSRKTGTVYFAINYAYSECEKHHYSVGKHDTCPICQSEIICQYTRVVGFITPTKSWNKTRKDWEYGQRVFYKNDELEQINVNI